MKSVSMFVAQKHATVFLVLYTSKVLHEFKVDPSGLLVDDYTLMYMMKWLTHENCLLCFINKNMLLMNIIHLEC